MGSNPLTRYRVLSTQYKVLNTELVAGRYNEGLFFFASIGMWRFLFFVWAIHALTSSAVAQQPPQKSDWPHWRGPAHDGSARGEQLIEAFPEGGPPVLWLRELGQGYSSFAVVGERAFTMTQTLYEQQLVCLEAATGKTVWTAKVGWPYDGGGLYPGPRSTPAVVGEHVFYCTPQGVAGCARVTDGEIVWQVNFHKDYEGKGTEFGYSCSPLVVDELVILPVGGENSGVIALRAKDGTLAWKAGKKPASYATPIPIEWRSEPLVVAAMQNSLCCIHRRTGELWWEVSLSAGYDEHSAAPLYREPHLLMASPFKGGATCYELVLDEKTGRCKPSLKWESTQLSNDVASSVLVGDTIYGFDLREAQSRLNRPSRGTFRALNWQTGEVLWSTNEPGHAQFIAADGKLIGLNDRGEVRLFRSSPENYEELGKVAIFPGEVCWTTPALSDGRLFLRTQTHAACLYLGRAPLAKETKSLRADEVVMRRFDPTVLLGAERDYPATKPEARDFRRWYGFGVVCIALAAALAAGANWLGRPIAAHLVFWIALFVAGAAGSWLVHRWQPEYFFSWPLALWAGYQLAILFSWSGSRAKFRSRERLISYGVGLAFLAMCGLYFHLLRWLGLALEWTFLAGFMLSFPVAATCEYFANRPGSYEWPRRFVASLLSFTAYFWSSVWFLDWWLG